MIRPTLSFRAPTLLTFGLLAAALCTGGLVSLGCGKSAPENPKKLPRVENPAMGIALGAVPPVFKVVSNEGAEIHLAPKEGEGEVTLLLERPEVGGVNLVQMVKDWKDIYQGMEQGKYLGQVELATQFGPAYTVRGSYLKDGAATEERRVFVLHPSGDQVLTLVYTYPEGKSSRLRAEELFEVVSELEALDLQPAAPDGAQAPLVVGGAFRRGRPPGRPVPQSRDMKSRNTYQNISATEAKSSRAAAT